MRVRTGGRLHWRWCSYVDGCAVRPGRLGHGPPRVSMAIAMSASGLWNPYDLRVRTRRWVLVASDRAFDRVVDYT